VRRWLSISFLLLLAVNFAGGNLFFIIRAAQIKNEMRTLLKTLPDDQLEIITLSMDEFKRVCVNEHEIKVNGKMYDIARIQVEGEILHVYCVHDEAEDNLLSFLDSVLIRLQDDSTQPPASVTAFVTLHFISTEFTFEFQHEELEPLTLTPYLQTDFLVSLVIDVPPPRV
jgi:hypothetical protein